MHSGKFQNVFGTHDVRASKTYRATTIDHVFPRCALYVFNGWESRPLQAGAIEQRCSTGRRPSRIEGYIAAWRCQRSVVQESQSIPDKCSCRCVCKGFFGHRVECISRSVQSLTLEANNIRKRPSATKETCHFGSIGLEVRQIRH